MKAALALPILAIPARAGAVETGEVGLALLGYQERGLMKVIEPVLWGRGQAGDWEFRASAAIDIVTGASPELLTNVSGRPVQTITGASVTDRRKLVDAKVSRRVGETTFGVSAAYSKEEDYRSGAFGVEARFDLNERNTTLIAGYGHASDRVESSDDPTLAEPRRTHEVLVGVSQVLSPVAAIQTTLQLGRGRGFFNDPYKSTRTFYPDGGVPAFFPDTRPRSRDTLAWVTRYRRHFPAVAGTLQADYRFYRDDWGIRAHTLEAGWHHAIDERWSVRPAVRYHTQSAADFYAPVVPRPAPAVLSSDQRLGAFGGISPSLRVQLRLESGWRVEGTLGYIENAARLRAGGGGSEAFETLRAYYGILGISRAF